MPGCSPGSALAPSDPRHGKARPRQGRGVCWDWEGGGMRAKLSAAAAGCALLAAAGVVLMGWGRTDEVAEVPDPPAPSVLSPAEIDTLDPTLKVLVRQTA